MNDAFNNEIETAITNATPSAGPFSIYWLNEDGPHDPIAKNKSLEMAFQTLMGFSGNDGYGFDRADGVMMLLLDGGAYRFTSANHDDNAARLEIMEHAVKHAWGEYKVQREG